RSGVSLSLSWGMPERDASASVLIRARRLDLLHRVADGEARRLRARRELLEALKHLRDDRLRRHQQECAMRMPVGVEDTLRSTLERIGAQVVDVRRAQPGELALPDPERRVRADLCVLFHECALVVADA